LLTAQDEYQKLSPLTGTKINILSKPSSVFYKKREGECGGDYLLLKIRLLPASKSCT
jgi:hypothetical protein